jgi:hypothetical protein
MGCGTVRYVSVWHCALRLRVAASDLKLEAEGLHRHIVLTHETARCHSPEATICCRQLDGDLDQLWRCDYTLLLSGLWDGRNGYCGIVIFAGNRCDMT